MAVHYDLATRAQVVTLRSAGVSHKEVAARTGVQARTQYKMVQRAKERGFDAAGGPLLNAHLEDAPKSGAPKKRTASFDAEVAEMVREEKSTTQIAEEFRLAGRNVSHQTVWRSLRKQGFKGVKATEKPGKEIEGNVEIPTN